MENKETITQLFEDNISRIYENLEDSNVSKKILECETEFLKSLSAEQQKIFNTLNDLKAEQRNKLDKDIYVFAFSQANRLMLESLKEI